ncbi:MAG: hypothetical protein O8C66_14300 [Candidatus Methanoperedens sp.]|nr:hypothetical protein [Candidatus Methanoperedens sp.]MCZ7371671.1 hypothetical protein [Candidatus Methanoperedens sp.]
MITLDDIEKMKEVRRMRYFNELFLKQEEFVLDQNYHIRMRRLHNGHLHSHGIVWGLEVVEGSNPTSVKIKPGMALNKVKAANEDDVSQEIILFAETDDIELKGTAAEGDGVYFYIYRFEEKNYTDESKGGSEEINWLETAKVELIAVKPENKPDNESHIILAKVKLIDGHVHIENEDRIYAGAYGKLALSVDGEESALSIEGKKFDAENGIQINSPLTNFTGGLRIGSTSEPGDKNLVVDGNCTVNGTLEVKSGMPGGLHIGGTSDPGDKNLAVDGNCTIDGNLTVKGTRKEGVVISDNIITVHDYPPPGNKKPLIGDGGLEVYRGGTAPNAQIIWREEAIEKNSKWKIGLENNLLDLVYGDNVLKLTDASIADELHKHSKLVGSDGSPDPALIVDNDGNVGIGIDEPSEKLLHVNGTVKATNINASGFSGDTLNLAENAEIMGNVGIGTLNPESKLEVRNGDLLVQPIDSMSGDYVRIHGSSPAPVPMLAEFIPDPVISFYEDGTQKADILWSKELEALLINNSAANTYINRNGGYVGIGTDKPSNELEVAGTVKADVFLGDGSQLTGASQWLNDPAGIYYDKGNVGIGTSTPGYGLDVKSNDGYALRLSTEDTNSDIRIQAEGTGGGGLQINSMGGSNSIYLMTRELIRISIDGKGNVELLGNLYVDGPVKAKEFIGDGSKLTGKTQWLGDPAGIYYKNNVGIGTPPSATDRLSVIGTIKADKFIGDGSGLTGINEGKWSDGAVPDSIFYNGIVGIGTKSPSGKLQIGEFTYAGEDQYVPDDYDKEGLLIIGNGYPSLTLLGRRWNGSHLRLGDEGEICLDIKGDNDDTSYIDVKGNSQGLEFRINGKEKMRIDINGNIFVGNAYAASDLSVNGTVSATKFIGDGSQLTGAGKWSDAAGGIYYDKGNVGIGTITPSKELEVIGTVKADAFVGDGSGLKNIFGASKWIDGSIAGRIYYNKGYVGIMTTDPVCALHVAGDVQAEGTMYSSYGFKTGLVGDLAENYSSDMDLEPGDVVRLDQDEDRIIISEKPDDCLVLGVISTAPGFLLNTKRDGEKVFPVALCGRVPCKVVDENGPIKRGNLLTSSSIPGHAMKASPIKIKGEELFRPGTIIGKALDRHESGKGVIDIFVYSS